MKDNFYTYCILKYKHSPFLDESVNIGVLIYFGSSKTFSFTYSKNLSRVKSIYNNVPERTIKEYLKRINDKLSRFHYDKGDLFPLNDTNLKEFLHLNILPIDAGVLQFSGFRTDILEFDEELYKNILLEQYFIEDIKAPSYKQPDAIIISNLFKELKNAGLEKVANKHRYVKNYPYKAETGTFNFDFAWKNGVWNLVKPISFDVKDPDYIIQKARHNLGELVDLEGQIDNKLYKCNIIIGKPKAKSHFKNYDKAREILDKVSKSVKIVDESNLKQYSQEVIEAVSQDI